ncbi:hypothetical protein GWK47_044504 [Chionoecetes opilio]|uniref:Uncharacterized protein n=1 Tax=Chionoecetes opilio TaxID=41210 RepID=A0A8J4YDW2_CHIOP|nr:hypothetical protein GWK47_044504 [Chionoecetes opilio]
MPHNPPTKGQHGPATAPSPHSIVYSIHRPMGWVLLPPLESLSNLTNLVAPSMLAPSPRERPSIPHPLYLCPISQSGRFDMMPKSGMGKEGGSITQVTPIHHDPKRSSVTNNPYKEVVFEPRPRQRRGDHPSSCHLRSV